MSNDINLVGFKRNHNVIDLELMVGGTPYLFWMNIADFINNIHQGELVVPFISDHKISIMKDTDIDGDDHFTASIVKPDGTFHSMGERIEEVAKIKITHRVIPGGDKDEMEIYVVKQMDDGSFKTNTVSVKLSDLYSAWSFSRGLDQYTKILVSKNDKVSRITITMYERAYEIDSESGGIKALGNRLDGVCYEFNLGDLDQDKYHDGGSFADDEEPIEQDTSPNGDLASLKAKVDELTELVKHQHRVITHIGNAMSITPPTHSFNPQQPPVGYYPPSGMGQGLYSNPSHQPDQPNNTSNSVLGQMNGLNQRLKAQQQPTATKEGIKDQPNFRSNFPK